MSGVGPSSRCSSCISVVFSFENFTLNYVGGCWALLLPSAKKYSFASPSLSEPTPSLSLCGPTTCHSWVVAHYLQLPLHYCCTYTSIFGQKNSCVHCDRRTDGRTDRQTDRHICLALGISRHTTEIVWVFQ